VRRVAYTAALALALIPLISTTTLAQVRQPSPPSPPPALTANPWQMRHWPRTQPWQQPQRHLTFRPGAPKPIDPQDYELPDTMTWDDYRAIPHTSWADPTRQGSVRDFRGALVLVDFPNQPFVVTQPKNSTIYGNPTAVDSLPRSGVPEFYKDFLNTPEALNHGHTINEYWMEDSGGRFGVNLTSFGVYQMPAKDHEYGIEESFQEGQGCPAGDTCERDIRTDARAAWVGDVGEETAAQFDFVFYLAAGQDESSTWQEFGPAKFLIKEDVPDEWGPPDPALPNWVKTRYVEWSSWAAGSNLWPNAGGGTSVQAESSGMSTYAHEFSHIIGIGDNYNNPFSVPPRRAYSGPWDMLSRGTFNGPGGPHSRWLIPGNAGSSMGAQHMLRNKTKLGIVDEQNVLHLSREALATSGVVVARVTAREVEPGAGGLTGVNVAMDSDKSPACDVNTDPLCDGGGYNNYTVEVVDRMGTDSFTPDAGVLLAKTKNQDRAPFIWVEDANPQDIDKVDVVLPNGQAQKMTVGDYRQLSDALLHAGTDSGSEYEYVDQANRLHFYVTDIQRDKQGILSYTVAIRSLDGAGPQTRGVAMLPGLGIPAGSGWVKCTLPLRNTGRSAPVPPGQPEDVTGYVNSDVYRLSAAVTGKGWTTWLPSALATARFGHTTAVQVWAKHDPSASRSATVRLTAKSESDPAKAATGSCHVR
jgi:M6 family metalloprotease-like protein